MMKKMADLIKRLRENLYSWEKALREKFFPPSRSISSRRSRSPIQNLPLNFNMEKVGHFLFAVESRAKIHKLFLLLLVSSVSYSFGKVVALLVSGAETVPRPRTVSINMEPPNEMVRKLSVYKSKNLFKTVDPDVNGKGPSSRPRVDKNIICKKSGQISTLPITLLNTIVLQDSVKSLAAVQVRGEQELKNLREGEKIDNMAEIGKIERLNIIIKNLQTGECEKVANLSNESKTKVPLNVVGAAEGRKLLMGAKMSGIHQEGNHISISRKLLNEKMSDMDNILTQARAIQVQNPDGTLAFKIVEIIPGSIFSFLGIQDGDNVTQIGGKKIVGLNDVLNLFANIQNVDNLQVTVVKDDGTEQNLEYEFVK